MVGELKWWIELLKGRQKTAETILVPWEELDLQGSKFQPVAKDFKKEGSS